MLILRFLVIVLSIAVAACSTLPRAATEFKRDLKCGMTREQVRAVSQRFQLDHFRCDSWDEKLPPGQCVAAVDSLTHQSMFILKFDQNDGLRAFEQGRMTFLAHYEVQEQNNLCGTNEFPLY
jgi:hypothetical protein